MCPGAKKNFFSCLWYFKIIRNMFRSLLEINKYYDLFNFLKYNSNFPSFFFYTENNILSAWPKNKNIWEIELGILKLLHPTNPKTEWTDTRFPVHKFIFVAIIVFLLRDLLILFKGEFISTWSILKRDWKII